MPACATSPPGKRRQIRLVGNDLVRNYGKKKFYSVHEVRNANRRQGIDIDVACWSHAFFNSHGDFDEYHASLGEDCDYAAMKQELLDAVRIPHDVPDTGGSAMPEVDEPWFDIDLSWLELPDIDFSIFDFFDL